MTLAIGVPFMRQHRAKDATSRVFVVIMAVVVVAECLISAVFLLVLLGEAAGVK